jgi:peptidoglycan/xylan/chitin deacetylase (PgdA/CDA1 family)
LRKFVLLLVLFIILLTACNSEKAPAVTPPPTTFATPSPILFNTSTPSPEPSPSPTYTPSPRPTLPPTPTQSPTPLPVFQTKLPANVSPQQSILDSCQELYLRWNPTNSQPGTVVVPIMFHSIARPDRTISDDTTITEEYFFRFMEWAHKLGYHTITSTQLTNFLYNNQKIPTLSMMLIVDDRKRAEFFTTYFIPYLQKYDWTVTNAWIAHPDTPAYLWKENEQFVSTGLIEFQAHGVFHNTPIDETVTDEYMRNEIYGAIAPIEQHFGAKPIAFIWPRGQFTPKAVQVTRQAGYQIGFTATSRGPLLFNWIPLGP